MLHVKLKIRTITVYLPEKMVANYALSAIYMNKFERNRNG